MFRRRLSDRSKALRHGRQYISILSPRLWSLHIQELLWDTFKKGGIGFGSGISAMPSLHVSMVFLFALVAWKIARALGIAFTVFAGFIVIGSVHLGWHYAIDDYAAIIGTWLIWWAVCWLLNLHAVFHSG